MDSETKKIMRKIDVIITQLEKDYAEAFQILQNIKAEVEKMKLENK